MGNSIKTYIRHPNGNIHIVFVSYNHQFLAENSHIPSQLDNHRSLVNIPIVFQSNLSLSPNCIEQHHWKDNELDFA